jgi:hypothetical protein
VASEVRCFKRSPQGDGTKRWLVGTYLLFFNILCSRVPVINMYIIEQALAMFSRRNTAVGQPSLERPPPAGDDVALSLVSRFAPRS